ncbi:MAG: hypothetical protein WC436_04050 [Candidatus Babeliales bacterium]
MLSNCRYNKVKVLHDMSKLLWFIEKHGIGDARQGDDSNCMKVLADLKRDLEKHIKSLNDEIMIENPELIDL